MRNRPKRLTPAAFVNVNAVMAKYACRAKLAGIGLGASTNALAAGWVSRNAAIGGGAGAPGPLAATARKNARTSSPVRAGNPLWEGAMISVWTCSARWNRTAIACGLDPFGSLSGTVGMPDGVENRTVIGVDGRAAWGARVKSAAPGAGTNVPAYIMPLACTGRNPGWTPPDSVSSTASRSVMRVLATAKAPERG